MGRPTTLTDKIADEICSLLEEGNYLETAAQSVGVSVNTVYSWLRQGAAGTEPFAAFSQAVTRARAQAEVEAVRTLRKGDGEATSFGPAKAAAHFLAVTRPERFATRVNVRSRAKLSEFLLFAEGQLKDILGEDQGELVFGQLCDRWLNRQPVELVPPGGSGPEAGDRDAGGHTLQ